MKILKKYNVGENIRNWHLKANLNDVLQVNKTSFMSVLSIVQNHVCYI